MSAVVKPLKVIRKLAIRVETGELAPMADQAERALAATLAVFDKGGALVLLDPICGATSILCPAVARIEMARAATWIKTIQTAQGPIEVPADPPLGVAEAIVKRGMWQHIPKLRAVVDHPLWCSAGRAHPGGYDKTTGIYCTARQPTATARADATREEAEEALCTLRDTLKTFPWASQVDEAAALAAMLAALSRSVMRIAPLILITAPAPGSGKALLARAISQFAQAATPPASPLAGEEEEIKKDLFSRLLEGQQVIFYDEVEKGPGAALDSISIRSLATSEIFSTRLLGASKSPKVSSCVNVLITANNATPAADSARRMLEIRLDPKCETPAARKFAGPQPAEIISARREEMIRAAMTVQAAFVHAGRPGLDDLPAASDFHDWNLWARGPVAWLMGIDPAARLIEAQKTDSAAGEVAATLETIYRRMSGTRWKAGDLLQHEDTSSAMREALGLPATREPSTQKIGRWLMGARDRLAGGFVLRLDSRASGSISWRIERA